MDEDEFIEQINQKIIVEEEKVPRTKRDQLNTFMTTFEWYNVEMAGFIQEHLENGDSMLVFPYLSQLYELLRITCLSIRSASAYDSLKKIIFSEYGAMAAFISVFTACEYIPKGMISSVASLFVNKRNNTPMQEYFATYYKNYAKNLETVSFYSHDYANMRAELQKGYRSCSNVSWADYLTYQYMVGETYLRSWISVPLKSNYTDPNNIVPATTNILVEYKPAPAKEAKKTKGSKEAKEAKEFVTKLEGISSSASVTLVKKPDGSDHIYIKENKEYKGNNQKLVYGLLEAPRYRLFTQTLRVLNQNHIKIKKIAGNNNIQIKCRIDAKNAKSLRDKEQKLATLPNVTPLFSYGDRIHLTRRMCLFEVPVKFLQDTVEKIDQLAEEKITLDFVHNF